MTKFRALLAESRSSLE